MGENGKQPMQADGGGSGKGGDPTGAGADPTGQKAAKSDSESQGGAYPNPHTGKGEPGAGEAPGDFLGHGGQSGMAYHGPGQLGEEAVGRGDEEKGRV